MSQTEISKSAPAARPRRRCLRRCWLAGIFFASLLLLVAFGYWLFAPLAGQDGGVQVKLLIDQLSRPDAKPEEVVDAIEELVPLAPEVLASDHAWQFFLTRNMYGAETRAMTNRRILEPALLWPPASLAERQVLVALGEALDRRDAAFGDFKLATWLETWQRSYNRRATKAVVWEARLAPYLDKLKAALPRNLQMVEVALRKRLITQDLERGEAWLSTVDMGTATVTHPLPLARFKDLLQSRQGFMLNGFDTMTMVFSSVGTGRLAFLIKLTDDPAAAAQAYLDEVQSELLPNAQLYIKLQVCHILLMTAPPNAALARQALVILPELPGTNQKFHVQWLTALLRHLPAGDSEIQTLILAMMASYERKAAESRQDWLPYSEAFLAASAPLWWSGMLNLPTPARASLLVAYLPLATPAQQQTFAELLAERVATQPFLIVPFCDYVMPQWTLAKLLPESVAPLITEHLSLLRDPQYDYPWPSLQLLRNLLEAPPAVRQALQMQLEALIQDPTLTGREAVRILPLLLWLDDRSEAAWRKGFMPRWFTEWQPAEGPDLMSLPYTLDADWPALAYPWVREQGLAVANAVLAKHRPDDHLAIRALRTRWGQPWPAEDWATVKDYYAKLLVASRDTMLWYWVSHEMASAWLLTEPEAAARCFGRFAPFKRGSMAHAACAVLLLRDWLPDQPPARPPADGSLARIFPLGSHGGQVGISFYTAFSESRLTGGKLASAPGLTYLPNTKANVPITSMVAFERLYNALAKERTPAEQSHFLYDIASDHINAYSAGSPELNAEAKHLLHPANPYDLLSPDISFQSVRLVKILMQAQRGSTWRYDESMISLGDIASLLANPPGAGTP
jgi:hypothetical protein